jgi:hypothetical protein
LQLHGELRSRWQWMAGGATSVADNPALIEVRLVVRLGG